MVKVEGLTTRPDLNGKLGRVVSFDAAADFDVAVLLEPGFQTQLSNWYSTLQILHSIKRKSNANEASVPLAYSATACSKHGKMRREAVAVAASRRA